MKKLYLIPFVLLLFTGCTTSKGRIAVLDLDLRSPEQITASQAEAALPYDLNTTPSPTGVPRVEAPSFPWNLAFDLLKVVKGRLRLITVEWGEK